MKDLILIAIVTLIVIAIGYPIVTALDKAKKEMEANERGNDHVSN